MGFRDLRPAAAALRAGTSGERLVNKTPQGRRLKASLSVRCWMLTSLSTAGAPAIVAAIRQAAGCRAAIDAASSWPAGAVCPLCSWPGWRRPCRLPWQRPAAQRSRRRAYRRAVSGAWPPADRRCAKEPIPAVSNRHTSGRPEKPTRKPGRVGGCAVLMRTGQRRPSAPAPPASLKPLSRLSSQGLFLAP
jgi:hypothetical protein